MQPQQAHLPRDFAKPEVRAFLDRLDLEEHERRRYTADRVLDSLSWRNVFGFVAEGMAWTAASAFAVTGLLHTLERVF